MRTHREKVLQDSVIVCCSTESCGPEGGYFTETPDSDDSMVGHTAFSRLDPVREILSMQVVDVGQDIKNIFRQQNELILQRRTF